MYVYTHVTKQILALMENLDFTKHKHSTYHDLLETRNPQESLPSQNGRLPLEYR